MGQSMPGLMLYPSRFNSSMSQRPYTGSYAAWCKIWILMKLPSAISFDPIFNIKWEVSWFQKTSGVPSWAPLLLRQGEESRWWISSKLPSGCFAGISMTLIDPCLLQLINRRICFGHGLMFSSRRHSWIHCVCMLTAGTATMTPPHPICRHVNILLLVVLRLLRLFS